MIGGPAGLTIGSRPILLAEHPSMQPSLASSPDPTRDPSRAGAPGTLAIVRLRPAADATLEDMRTVAERVREHFVTLPGLRRKYFAYSCERHEVVNVYVWPDSRPPGR
jgi:hypothetical protein